MRSLFCPRFNHEAVKLCAAHSDLSIWFRHDSAQSRVVQLNEWRYSQSHMRILRLIESESMIYHCRRWEYLQVNLLHGLLV